MSEEKEVTLEMEPIGVIHTPFKAKEQAPIQGAFNPDVLGTVEVFEKYEAGLTDIGGFSHIILIYALDRSGPVEMLRMPFLSDEAHGVFATRHPARPNPIGLTVVRLVAIEGARIEVAGVDMLDGTPLLDIKPYVPRFDAFPEASEGWLSGCEDRPKPAGRE